MTTRYTTIEISKQDLKFSAAHFTVFSATERERLHGHNFRVRAELCAPVDDNGLCFDYQQIKSRLRKLCKSLDEYMLLPEHSPHLKITSNTDTYSVAFAEETLQFNHSDTLLLPIHNTTVEELSYYLLQVLRKSDNFLIEQRITSLTIAVSSGDGQWGSSRWDSAHAP
ncbi:MAG: 6-carboxytetrahydropterin synthase [Gammaproteobacteria bacterium]|nr:6-carboxytetrahydropterin synthase [Gammaproteobacteria bacterium]NND39358.1 6-pyruvoyl tetrahydropterin synthase [Pseudomonadales bacterium]MBT8151306.1 6-carboxytetrahydropterin synthase [Gammaproteobacteria bacterium]NNL10449.1 6-pyruvoyl tetrahydropterin synthase [Pseudomonadales bacterium]NNM10505.1 6-pyruvoyl tetrahydropterin synthase [Pseudomonadales bacterium]